MKHSHRYAFRKKRHQTKSDFNSLYHLSTFLFFTPTNRWHFNFNRLFSFALHKFKKPLWLLSNMHTNTNTHTEIVRLRVVWFPSVCPFLAIRFLFSVGGLISLKKNIEVKALRHQNIPQSKDEASQLIAFKEISWFVTILRSIGVSFSLSASSFYWKVLLVIDRYKVVWLKCDARTSWFHSIDVTVDWYGTCFSLHFVEWQHSNARKHTHTHIHIDISPKMLTLKVMRFDFLFNMSILSHDRPECRNFKFKMSNEALKNFQSSNFQHGWMPHTAKAPILPS